MRSEDVLKLLGIGAIIAGAGYYVLKTSPATPPGNGGNGGTPASDLRVQGEAAYSIEQRSS